jgi:hypothetical protein
MKIKICKKEKRIKIPSRTVGFQRWMNQYPKNGNVYSCGNLYMAAPALTIAGNINNYNISTMTGPFGFTDDTIVTCTNNNIAPICEYREWRIIIIIICTNVSV